jgi:MoxR-like ATPase
LNGDPSAEPDEVSLDALPTRRVAGDAGFDRAGTVSDPIGSYIVDIVSSTRTSQRVQVGASPRGSLAILKLSRAKAALAGRDFVTPEDVKAVAVPALSHRLILRPELWVQRVRPEDVVRESLETVPAPAAEDLPTHTG